MSMGRPPWRIALIPAVAGLFMLAGCDNGEERTQAPPRPVVVVEVAALDMAEQVALPGVTQAIRRAALAFEVGGRVTQVPAALGDRVKEGDVLARLDDIQYRLAREQRASELAEAEASLADAQAELGRKQELFEEGWVAEASLISIRTARDAAARRVDALTAALGRAQEDLNETVLRAPYDGEIADRMVEPSQRVAAGQPIFDIQGDAATTEIVVQVPETLVDRLDREADHSVRIPRLLEEPVTARLSEVSPAAARDNAFRAVLETTAPLPLDSTGTTAEVTLTLMPPNRRSGDGTSGSQAAGGGAVADGADGGGTLLTIPLNAYAPGTDGGATVFRLDPSGETVTAVSVTIVRLQDAVAVIDGPLQPGDPIVARGVAFLSDGMAVSPLGDGPARYNP